jgi:ubiquinone/menaquinone biosynthesis C-methylase UbiE
VPYIYGDIMIKWDDYWVSYTVSKAERWLILERDKIINKYLNMIEDSPKNIIEVGCGYGSNLSLIKEARDDVECYALDNSEIAIEKIKERIPNAVLADCLDTKLPDNKFDIIYSAGLMEHFKDESPFLNEMKRILKERALSIIPFR